MSPEPDNSAGEYLLPAAMYMMKVMDRARKMSSGEWFLHICNCAAVGVHRTAPALDEKASITLADLHATWVGMLCWCFSQFCKVMKFG